MESSSSSVRSAWSMTPVSAASSSPVSRSTTMSAPTRRAASPAAVRARVRAIRSAWPSAPDEENAQPIEPTRPMRSSPRRSSGWKMTTSASRPTTAPVSRIPESNRRSSSWASAYTAYSTIAPMTRRTARVPWMRLNRP